MAGRFSVEAVFKAVDKVTAPVTRMQDRVGRFTRAIEKGLRKALHVTNEFGEKLKSVGEKIAAVGEKVAAFTGLEFAAVAETINHVAEATDELGKRARRLKFPIEALQEWEYVAKQAGIGTDEFDTAIDKFGKNVGQAKMRAGALFGSLQRYNPALLRQIRHAKDAGAAFDIYIAALRKTKDPLVRLAMASDAFGKGVGVKFAGIAEMSAHKLAELRKEVLENGIATEHDAEQAELYVEALNALKGAFQGLVRSVVMPLLPDITEKLRHWREWLLEHRANIQKYVIEIMHKAWAAMQRFVAILGEISEKHDVFGLLAKGADMLLSTIEFLNKYGEMIVYMVGSFLALTIVLKTLVTIMALVNLVMAANPLVLLAIGIAALIAGLYLMITHWREVKAQIVETAAAIMKEFAPVGTFFKNLWDGVALLWGSTVNRILAAVLKIRNAIQFMKEAPGKAWDWTKNEMGLGSRGDDGHTSAAAPTPLAVDPQERLASTYHESRSTAEVTIRDETGRATLTRGSLAGGVTLIRSGSFA